MKTQPTITVYTIRDKKQRVVYVGKTTKTPEKVLSDMSRQARTKTSPRFDSPIFAFLRQADAEYWLPGYAIEGQFKDPTAAKEKVDTLLIGNRKTVLNDYKGPQQFKKVEA